MLASLITLISSNLNTCDDVQEVYQTSKCCDAVDEIHLPTTYTPTVKFPVVDNSFIEEHLFQGSEFVIVNEMFTQTPITQKFANTLSLFDRHFVDIAKTKGFWDDARATPKSGYSYNVGDISYKRVFGIHTWDELLSWYTMLGELNQLVDLSLGGNGIGLTTQSTLLPYDTQKNTFKVYCKNATKVKEWFRAKDKFPNFDKLSTKTQQTMIRFLKIQNPALSDEQAISTLTSQYATYTVESYTAQMGSVPSPIEYIELLYPGTAFAEFHLTIKPSYKVTELNKISFRLQSEKSKLISHYLTSEFQKTRLYYSELTPEAFKNASLDILMIGITFTGLNIAIGPDGYYGPFPEKPVVVYTTDSAAATVAMTSPNSFPTRAEFETRDPIYGVLFGNAYLELIKGALNLPSIEAAGVVFDQFSFKQFTELINLQGKAQIKLADPSTRWIDA